MSLDYPKTYPHKRIVHAKLYIDLNFAVAIDLDNIPEEAYFSKFHFIRLLKDDSGNWFSLGQKKT